MPLLSWIGKGKIGFGFGFGDGPKKDRCNKLKMKHFDSLPFHIRSGIGSHLRILSYPFFTL